MRKQKSLTYSQVGDNYDTKDPIKKLAQTAAKRTGVNLKKHGFEEISDSRGESAFVWSLGRARDKNSILMASVIEGLGTKNLVADAMGKIVDLFEPEPIRSEPFGGEPLRMVEPLTGRRPQSRRPERSRRTYYDVVGHDTVATIINDLVTVGAKPLVIHAYWVVEDNKWLQDKQRMIDLINGWKKACDLAGATWGGGETATMKQIMMSNTAEFAGSAVGIISPKKNLITDKKLKSGDRILLCRSNGVNANGISLTRAVAKRLPKGYATKLLSGKMYGEALLTKTNIYAKLVQDLLNGGVDLHYISNITGHGLRKIMRARQNYAYVIEKVFEPQEIFLFIQKHANLDDYEMYQTYNMGMDYAIFLPEKDMKKAQSIVKKNGFKSINAGYVEKGERQVIIKPKNLIYKSSTLDLR